MQTKACPPMERDSTRTLHNPPDESAQRQALVREWHRFAGVTHAGQSVEWPASLFCGRRLSPPLSPLFPEEVPRCDFLSEIRAGCFKLPLPIWAQRVLSHFHSMSIKFSPTCVFHWISNKPHFVWNDHWL